MKLALEVPINNVSFGQVSTVLLKTIYEREKAGDKSIEWYLFPIGNPDLSAQTNDDEFNKWLQAKIARTYETYSRDINIFKLWHFNGSLQSFGKHQTLLTFYELDNPTKIELNIARNSKLCLSSKYACDVFKIFGGNPHYLPLAFDSCNFKVTGKKYHTDDRIIFNLCGKFERRKHHQKIVNAWIKKYGKNPKYALQAALFNPFLGNNPQEIQRNNEELLKQLAPNKPFNVTFYPHMRENVLYNDFLNSADIIIGMSGGEGFGLPEFHSIGLGKHAVMLNAHSYKDFANDKNAVMVEPTGKITAVDNMFFRSGDAFNQGQIFDWDDEQFLAACDLAIQRVEKDRVNHEGLKIQQEFTKDKFLDNVISLTK